MSERTGVGAAVAVFLEYCGVEVAFGVISIHNMPILDAIGTRSRIRFVPSRGEAGAVNMADAAARVSGTLGVVITSTGTAAGNGAGGLIEAQSAGTPLLHITGQIELPHLDRDRAYIHEARDQFGMLRAVSKAAYRAWSPETVVPTLREAVRVARTPPTGPVSVEIPIDVQEASARPTTELEPHPVVVPVPSPAALDRLAAKLERAQRPLLWLGGGARGAADAVARLAELGVGVVTSTQGRGILPEDHPMSLGAFTMHEPVEAFYRNCDAMLVAGSRLRGNETLTYGLQLPRPLYQIDADARAENRAYPVDDFVLGDAALALTGLAERLAGRQRGDVDFADDLRAVRTAAEAKVRGGQGPYASLIDALEAAGKDFLWVRDVTISNSTWGNRLPALARPRAGVHAVGGGIGQGLPMAIGAALAGTGRKTICLVGDGGLQLSLGELATAAEAQANLVLLVMNSGGYGVIKNIQDARFGGRHYYADLLTPDFGKCCAAVGIRHQRLSSLDQVDAALGGAMVQEGPAMIEFDMAAIGDFSTTFAGPPVREKSVEPV